MDDTEIEACSCEICGNTWHGENAKLSAERCRDAHQKIFISVWDFELPKLISYFNTGNREYLPKEFVNKIRKLEARALRGKNA